MLFDSFFQSATLLARDTGLLVINGRLFGQHWIDSNGLSPSFLVHLPMRVDAHVAKWFRSALWSFCASSGLFDLFGRNVPSDSSRPGATDNNAGEKPVSGRVKSNCSVEGHKGTEYSLPWQLLFSGPQTLINRTDSGGIWCGCFCWITPNRRCCGTKHEPVVCRSHVNQAVSTARLTSVSCK